MGGGAKLGTVTAAVGGVPTLPSSSSSSSKSRVPVSGNFRRDCANCVSHGGVCRCEYGGLRQGERANGPFINRVLGPVPSRFEVENAIAALQSFLQGISSSGSESDQRIMETQRYSRVSEAFRLLQTDSSVQRMVMSLSSDKAVWDAILNKMVRKLREPLLSGFDRTRTNLLFIFYAPFSFGEENRQIIDDFLFLISMQTDEENTESSSEEPDLGTLILRWILAITKAKIMELVKKFQSLVNEVFQSPGREEFTTKTTEMLDERIVSSTFLAIVILLIVAVARTQNA